MSGLKKNIIFIIILLVVVVIGITWFMYSGPSGDLAEEGGVITEPTTPGSPTAPPRPNFAGVRAEILSNVNALRAIELDTTILKDAAFIALKKPVRQATTELQVGRSNPFLPY